MFRRILQRMRDKISIRQYIVTHHARKEMNDDGFTIYDVERGILTGEILERQRDRMTGEAKYRLQGKTIGGFAVEILTKLSPTGTLVIITVYRP